MVWLQHLPLALYLVYDSIATSYQITEIPFYSKIEFSSRMNVTEDIKMSNKHVKDTPYHMSPGKGKLKQQQDTITHLLEWPKPEGWHQMVVKMCSNRNFRSLLVGTQSHILTLEVSLVVSHKTEHTRIIISSNCTSWYLPNGVKNLRSHKNLNVDVYSSFIYYRQNVRATKIAFSRQMDT